MLSTCIMIPPYRISHLFANRDIAWREPMKPLLSAHFEFNISGSHLLGLLLACLMWPILGELALLSMRSSPFFYRSVWRSLQRSILKASPNSSKSSVYLKSSPMGLVRTVPFVSCNKQFLLFMPTNLWICQVFCCPCGAAKKLSALSLHVDQVWDSSPFGSQFLRGVCRFTPSVVKVILRTLLQIFQYLFLIVLWFLRLYFVRRCGRFSPLDKYGHRRLSHASVTIDSVVTFSHILHLLSWASFFLCFPNSCWKASIKDLSFWRWAVGHHWLYICNVVSIVAKKVLIEPMHVSGDHCI